MTTNKLGDVVKRDFYNGQTANRPPAPPIISKNLAAPKPATTTPPPPSTKGNTTTRPPAIPSKPAGGKPVGGK